MANITLSYSNEDGTEFIWSLDASKTSPELFVQITRFLKLVREEEDEKKAAEVFWQGIGV